MTQYNNVISWLSLQEDRVWLNMMPMWKLQRHSLFHNPYAELPEDTPLPTCTHTKIWFEKSHCTISIRKNPALFLSIPPQKNRDFILILTITMFSHFWFILFGLFVKVPLLRYNSHIIEFTHITYVVQWFLVYSQICTTIIIDN